ncbi:hypothetical protein [Novosphingobium sp. KA1]|uniref:hypothetical protein n=1 Tax=Novosphingobium sp. (strain KA1) TaxID=164608 RepID=UPI001A900F3C|nr:hypothetical protein [Novosphingobium sp. KA1]QSR16056.1 hypothetical protein CA833_02395 [Novosphingobium sp. KA1]
MTVIRADFDLSVLQRAARAFGAEQMPFAEALALTRLAKGVSAEESRAVVDTFDNPTPFTQKAFTVRAATKAVPIAYVSAKDIAVQYLAPYVFGGERSLGAKRTMLVPKASGTNQYGNLPRNKLKTLKGKPNVFVGTVATKGGQQIAGVWQRPSASAGRGKRNAGRAAQSGLKLLIRFSDTTEAPKHLPFFESARAYVARHAADEFRAALRQALATSRGRR